MTTFLEQLEADIERCIEENSAACVDSVGRKMLDSLNRQLNRYLVRLRQDIACKRGPLGAGNHFGPNAHGPAIDDLIRQSKFHRELAAVKGQGLTVLSGKRAA